MLGRERRNIMKEFSSSQSPDPSPSQEQPITRRKFLERAGALTATSAVAGASMTWVHAGEDNTIRLALIGCGGRGSGAVSDAFDSPHGPVKLFAMADLFAKRLDSSY